MLVHRRSPGFGLTLVAETLNGSFFSAEMSSTPQGQGDPVLPEDLGRNCAKLLLEEIYRVGTAKAHLPHALASHPLKWFSVGLTWLDWTWSQKKKKTEEADQGSWLKILGVKCDHWGAEGANGVLTDRTLNKWTDGHLVEPTDRTKMDDIRAPQNWSQNVSVSPWWWAAV